MRTRIKGHRTKDYRTSRMLGTVGILIALLLGSACQGSSGSANSVQGTVNYLENLELTDDAVLRVSLRDTSYADASAELIAEKVIANPGQVPIKFKVDYDPGAVDPRNTYSIAAAAADSLGNPVRRRGRHCRGGGAIRRLARIGGDIPGDRQRRGHRDSYDPLAND